MAKIGRSVRMKQEDKGPYYTLGIAATQDGYEVRKLKMHGDEVLSIEVLKKLELKAEAMQQLQIEVSSYIIAFNQKGG